MSSLGAWLRTIRGQRGISLDTANAETGIKKQFLAAIESDDYEQLPPEPIYVKSFIRSYAEFLGVSGEQAVACYLGKASPPPAGDSEQERMVAEPPGEAVASAEADLLASSNVTRSRRKRKPVVEKPADQPEELPVESGGGVRENDRVNPEGAGLGSKAADVGPVSMDGVREAGMQPEALPTVVDGGCSAGDWGAGQETAITTAYRQTAERASEDGRTDSLPTGEMDSRGGIMLAVGASSLDQSDVFRISTRQLAFSARRRSDRIWKVIFVLVLLLAVAGIGYFLLSPRLDFGAVRQPVAPSGVALPDQGQAPGTAGQTTVNPLVANPASGNDTPDRPAAAKQVKLEITAKGDCWIEAVVDGEVKYSDLLAGGKSLTLSGQGLTVTYGDCSAVVLKLDGVDIGRPGNGGSGEVYTAEYGRPGVAGR
ncbi:MAG: helix-turn-helix domain-containing protein [Negativicutes bacterium]|nr:helix-turn-helix domain-containing protein [Negativicutes bacterium]